MVENGPNILHEKETVERMIRFYCNKNHKSSEGSLCEDCDSLLVYAHKRLDYCQFGEDKTTCRKCPVHCYNPEMRQRIKQVMRFSGPRLALRAPITWIRHWVHDRE